jgi:hypothetical protein
MYIIVRDSQVQCSRGTVCEQKNKLQTSTSESCGRRSLEKILRRSNLWSMHQDFFPFLSALETMYVSYCIILHCYCVWFEQHFCEKITAISIQWVAPNEILLRMHCFIKYCIYLIIDF